MATSFDISSLSKISAYYSSARALDFGNAYGLSNKDYQNRLVSANILRKSVQLVEDLENARARTNAFKSNTALQSSTVTPLEYAQKNLTASIREILNLRQKLGIETPANGIGKSEILQRLAGQTRGDLVNVSS